MKKRRIEVNFAPVRVTNNFENPDMKSVVFKVSWTTRDPSSRLILSIYHGRATVSSDGVSAGIEEFLIMSKEPSDETDSTV